MGILDEILGTATNPFGAPSTGEWNLARGIYTTKETGRSMVFFFESASGEDRKQRTALDSVADTGGRRLAVYEYPYRDGQRIADLGRKGETFAFNLKFHGLNYQEKFQEFLDVVANSNEAGTIVHPVRGSLSVRFRDWEYLHHASEWNSVSIKAVFVEDSTDELAGLNMKAGNPDSVLRSTLQSITSLQSSVSNLIFEVGAALLIPQAIQNAMNNRLTSITGQASRLLGQLAATFSTDTKLKQLASQANSADGGVSGLSSGTATSSGSSVAASLPPVFQVGFDPTTQAAVNAQTSNFVNANQVTPQQAVFAANQVRQSITTAINEVVENYGNFGADIILGYRQMAISIQESVEASVATSQTQVKLFTLRRPMSLRMIAKENGISPERQNEIESLNPYLPSVNYIPAGTQVTVPAS